VKLEDRDATSLRLASCDRDVSYKPLVSSLQLKTYVRLHPREFNKGEKDDCLVAEFLLNLPPRIATSFEEMWAYKRGQDKGQAQYKKKIKA
jgi:hypothetical protein